MYQPRPHVSAALHHLRWGVLVASIALSAALTAQMLVWGFVHFTTVRTVEIEGKDRQDEPVRVVTQRPQVGSMTGPSSNSGASIGIPKLSTGANEAGVSIAEQDEGPMNPNLVPSSADRLLELSAGLTQTVGVIAAFLLAALMFQGTLVAGGASVPGVERVVTASSWTMLIALLALPLQGIIPSVSISGVFSGYAALVEGSERVRAPGAPGLSKMAYYIGHLLLPMILMGLTAWSTLRFRSGLERGLIATSVSEAHEKLEREIRARKNLGEGGASRAGGALDQTMQGLENLQAAVGGIQSAIPQHSHPSPMPVQMPQPQQQSVPMAPPKASELLRDGPLAPTMPDPPSIGRPIIEGNSDGSRII